MSSLSCASFRAPRATVPCGWSGDAPPNERSGLGATYAAGYSGTSLPRKLGPQTGGCECWHWNATTAFPRAVADAPADPALARAAGGLRLRRSHLRRRFRFARNFRQLGSKLSQTA